MKVLLDTNVVLDVLQRREPWFNDGSAIFYAVATRQLAGCLTAKQIADIHFFARKLFRGQENVDEKARQVITNLMTLFELLDTLASDCQNAISIDNGDYEDAMLIASAARSGVDCIVTRNQEHFRLSSVSVYSPSELVQILSHQD